MSKASSAGEVGSGGAAEIDKPTAEKKKTTSAPQTQSSIKERPVETKLERASRLTGLIDIHLAKTPMAVDAATKCMHKIKDVRTIIPLQYTSLLIVSVQMNLSMDELKASKFAEALNNLRKHSNSDVAAEAKKIRQILKQVTFRCECHYL